MSYDGRGVGLANATNSNTDTSARVHTTCRVCLNLYNSLADPNLVRNNPNEFKAIKDEIALGLGRPFAPFGISYAEQRGLAPVFTNTSIINGASDDDLMRWYIKFYDCRTKAERREHCETPCSVKGQAYYPSELYFAGIVISEAEADPMNGDNALTLLIGGKMTICNGHFPVSAGQWVMWYFEEEVEANMFDQDGMRRKRSTAPGARNVMYNNTISKQQKKIRDNSYAERALLKRPAFIKPFCPGIHGLGVTRADWSRVVGIAQSNAGAYERVDVKFSRMSH